MVFDTRSIAHLFLHHLYQEFIYVKDSGHGKKNKSHSNILFSHQVTVDVKLITKKMDFEWLCLRAVSVCAVLQFAITNIFLTNERHFSSIISQMASSSQWFVENLISRSQIYFAETTQRYMYIHIYIYLYMHTCICIYNAKHQCIPNRI